VFLGNPFPFLEKSIKRRDMLVMYSPRQDQLGPINSGFIYFSPTKKSKILLRSYENVCLIKRQSDQQLWNHLLRHYMFQQIEYRILPRNMFFILWESATKYGYSTNVTLVLHSASDKKAERLMELGQWHLQPTCHFYDTQAFEVAHAKNLISNSTTKSSQSIWRSSKMW